MEEQQSNELKNQILSEQALEFLNETAKWAKFLTIVAVIFFSLMIIIAFTMGKIMDEFYPNPLFGSIMGVFYILMGAVYVYPVIAMLKFSNFTKLAYFQKNNEYLTEAFRNLKGTFQYIGILTIIGLALYGFGILMFLIMGLAIGF